MAGDEGCTGAQAVFITSLHIVIRMRREEIELRKPDLRGEFLASIFTMRMQKLACLECKSNCFYSIKAPEKARDKGGKKHLEDC